MDVYGLSNWSLSCNWFNNRRSHGRSCSRSTDGLGGHWVSILVHIYNDMRAGGGLCVSGLNNGDNNVLLLVLMSVSA